MSAAITRRFCAAASLDAAEAFRRSLGYDMCEAASELSLWNRLHTAGAVCLTAAICREGRGIFNGGMNFLLASRKEEAPPFMTAVWSPLMASIGTSSATLFALNAALPKCEPLQAISAETRHPSDTLKIASITKAFNLRQVSRDI